MRVRSVWLTKFVARVIVVTMKLLFVTCRKEFAIFPGTNGWDADVPDRFVFGVWHEVLTFPLLMAQPQHMSALTSQHRDGSYIAECLKILKVVPFRGSTNRGGVRAVRQMLQVAQRLHITLTPDGPRGPRRVLKDGLVYLAARTQQAIVPAAFGCRRGLHIKGSWTDMLVPLPFTTTYCVLGEPIHIPAELTRHEIEQWTQRVQVVMDQLYARLDDWIVGRTGPPEFAELHPGSRREVA